MDKLRFVERAMLAHRLQQKPPSGGNVCPPPKKDLDAWEGECAPIGRIPMPKGPPQDLDLGVKTLHPFTPTCEIPGSAPEVPSEPELAFLAEISAS